MRKKFFDEHGAIPVGIAVLLLVTSLMGLVAGYKAVQTPTQTQSKAATYTCDQLKACPAGSTQGVNCFPNANCLDTKPGPCAYGAWIYDCTKNPNYQCKDRSVLVGVPYWCDGTVYHNMNNFGECTNKCPAPTSSPNQPTQPPLPQGSNNCFYLTAQISNIGDVWVTFNPAGSPPITGDIELIRNNAGVAGPNPWNQGSGPFTFHPGSYPPYQKVTPGSSVNFTGRMDVCGERGNRDDITCSLSADGNTVAGTPGRCFKYGTGTGGVGATNTPIPPRATNTPQPGQPTATTAPGAPTNTPIPVRPTNTPTPTPTPPPDWICGAPPKRCCRVGDDIYPPQCTYGECIGGDCIYPTPIPPTPTPVMNTIHINTTVKGSIPALRRILIAVYEHTAPYKFIEKILIATSETKEFKAEKGKILDVLVEDRFYDMNGQEKKEFLPKGTIINFENCQINQNPCVLTINEGQSQNIKLTVTFPGASQSSPLAQAVTNIANRAVEFVVPIIPGYKPPEQTPQQQQPTSISGKVRVNNSTFASVEKVMVALYSDKEASSTSLLQETQVNLTNKEGAFEFGNLENKEYYLAAFVRTSGNEVYSSEKATTKVGQKVNLTINIGEQGLRYTITKTRELGTTARARLSTLPVVGPFIEMFIISAF